VRRLPPRAAQPPPPSLRRPASTAQPPPPSLRRLASPLDAADSIVASEVATFSLPFAKLGVPPEGCSSALFVEHMGEATAQRILGPEAWIPTAAQAMDVGFPTVDEVVPGGNAECVARAVEVSNQV
jgi:enoyl-CoA hydratase/carnithine racemase